MSDPEIQKLIQETADASCDALQKTARELGADLEQAARLVADAIAAGGRTLICGNGGSAADSQHMAAELVGRYLKERDAYAAVALSTDTSIMTAVANDYGFDAVFERQVRALGRAGDVLIGISTSGNSENVLRAMNAAREIGLKTVALTGRGGGKLASLADVLLAVPADHTPRIQESHSMIVHLLCEIIENLFTAENS